MNKKVFLPLVLFSLAMTGCVKGASKLDAPVLSVNDAKTGLKWTEVKGAASYELKVNNVELGSVTSYAFDEKVGNYSVCVRAVSEDKSKVSDYSTAFQYSTAEAAIGDLSIEDGKIKWASVSGSGVEVKKDDGSYEAASGDSFITSGAGIYTVRAKAGWNDSENKFYISGSKNSKTIYVVPTTTTPYVLEDGTAADDATLQETYSVEKYDGTWKESGASIVLNDTANAGATSGSCVQLNYWRHSAYFKYAKAITVTESRNAMELDVKGDGVSKMVLAFQIMNDRTIGGLQLKGVYIKYTIDLLPAKWEHHVIPFADNGWKVNYAGNDMSFSDIKTTLGNYGYTFNSMADLITMTDEFQIRVYATADENWTSTKIWMDNVKLVDSNKTAAEVEEILVVKDKYTAVSSNFLSGIDLHDDGTMDFGNAVGTWSKANKQLTINLNEPSLETTWVMESDDGGETFEVVSSTGHASAFGNNFQLIPYVYTVDSFDTYHETGIGFDANHTDPTAVTGLRAHYYSDYYNEAANSTSPIGGNNWWLMGSSDYLDLMTDYSGHLGFNCVKYKFNPTNPMRMISGSLCQNATSPAMGQGSVFSFFAKGCTKYDISIKVRVYYNSAKLTPSTQQSDSDVLQLTIPQNSGWTQYKVAVKADKPIYGFSFTTVANWKSGNDYFYIDDIRIYGSVDPWTIYKVA